MTEDKNQKIKNFTDLEVWRQAHQLVLEIYKTTKLFPREETYSLVDQMRRAVISISSNIAEGFSRQSYSKKVHFYSISQGSLTELQNQLIVARDINYLRKEKFEKIFEQSVNVNKILNGLLRKTKSFRDL